MISRTVVRTIARLLVVAVAVPLSSSTFAQKAKKPAQRPRSNQVKGQGQLAGVNGQFGVVYSLSNGFNMALLGARYTIEPFDCLDAAVAQPNQKLIVLDLAIKNASPEDNWFSLDDFITLVDSAGNTYTRMSNVMRESTGSGRVEMTLRPGQGLGHRELKDPLRFAMMIPDDARIVKIMVNRPRRSTKEQVIRYYVAGATKAEAGEAGDPKNVIEGLPAGVRDPKDSSGAVALEMPTAELGKYFTSGGFALRLDRAAIQPASPTEERETSEDERYLVCTLTAKALIGREELSMFDVTGADPPSHVATLADGDTVNPLVYRHATRDAAPEHSFRKGVERTYRVVFVLPADGEAATLTFGAREGRLWSVNIKGAK